MLIAILIYGAGMSLSFWGAYLLAVRLCGDGPAYIRLAGAFVLHAWLLLALFHLLAFASVFLVPVAYACLILFGAGMHLWTGRTRYAADTMRSDADAFRKTLKRLPGTRWAWLVLPAMLIYGLLLLRGLMAPPLEWDALTYHLPKAALWVQNGGYASWTAPGATSYYQYFVSGGDILSAWAMLAAHGDALLAFSSAWSVLAASALLYSTARTLGLSRGLSFLFALSIMTVPAVLHYAANQYVDTLHVSVLLFGIFSMVSALRKQELRSAVLSAAALGVAAAIKITTLPYLAVIGAVFAWYVAARCGTWKERGTWTGALLIGLLVGMPDYLHAWISAGSPVYPLELDLGPLGLFHGNEEFVLLHSGSFWPEAGPMPAAMFLGYLFAFTRESWNHLNFGYAGAVLSIVGVSALVMRGWRPSHRAVSATIVLVVAVGALMFASDSSAVYRLELWGPIVGRLLLLQAAVVALAGALMFGDRVRWVFGLAIVVNLFQALPAGLGRSDGDALAQWWPAVLAAAALFSVAILLFVRNDWWRQSALLSFLALIVLVIPADHARTDLRYRYYQEAEKGIDGAFFAHPLEPHFVSAWPLWKYLDQERPVRIAMAAGWDGYGQNWFWYPLFGSRLQNDVRYVPVTEKGDIIDYRRQDLLGSRASPDAWLRRLDDERIEYLAAILLAPESAWAAERPAVFSPVAVSDDSLHVAYRIDRDELQRTIGEEKSR